MAKRSNNQLQTKYYDENGQVVNFDKETIEKYFDLERQLKDSFVSIGKSLHQIQNEKLYLIRNYTDFKTYVTDIFGYSYRMVQNYIRVHETFGDSEYAGLPITKLVKLAGDSKAIEVYQKSKNKTEALQNLLFELKQEKTERDITPTSEKPILSHFEVMRSFREDINLFIEKTLEGEYLTDDKAVMELAKIKKDLNSFWDKMEPVILNRIDEINSQEEEVEEEIKQYDNRTMFNFETFTYLEPDVKNKTINRAVLKLVDAYEKGEMEDVEYLEYYLTQACKGLPDPTALKIIELFESHPDDSTSKVQGLLDLRPIQIDWV